VVDRLPIVQMEQVGNVKGPFPPHSDEGAYSDVPGFEHGGGPPRKDRRRSRSLGQNVAAIGSNVGSATFIPGVTIGDAQLCAWDPRSGEDEEAESLIVQLKAYDYAEGAVDGVSVGSAAFPDPFAGVVASQLPNGVKQQLIVLARLQWGHDGVNKEIAINLGIGQIIKSPLGASYMKARGRMGVKYYPRLVTVPAPFVGPTATTYLSTDPNTRNNLFNAIDSQVLSPQNGVNFDAGTIPKTPVHVEGVVARGFPAVTQGAASDRSSRAVRKFFGTFPVTAGVFPAAGSQIVFCPIAFGASSVMFRSNPSDFNNGANINGTLLWGMIDHAGEFTAQLLPNVFIPLEDSCQQIFIYNTTANGAETPFELIFDMGL
jgi:hypothetical protein